MGIGIRSREGALLAPLPPAGSRCDSVSLQGRYREHAGMPPLGPPSRQGLQCDGLDKAQADTAMRKAD